MTEPISTQCAWTDSNQIGSDNYSPGGSLVPGSSESKESSPYSYQPARSSLRVVEPTLSKAAHKVFAHKLPTKVHFRNKEAQQREENVRVSISCKGVLKATSNKEGSPAVVVTSLLAHKHFLSHCWRNVDLKHRKNDMFSNLTEKARLPMMRYYMYYVWRFHRGMHPAWFLLDGYAMPKGPLK